MLSAELNRTNVEATSPAGILVRTSVADKSVTNSVRVADVETFKKEIEKNLVRQSNGADNNGRTVMKFRLQNVDAASAALTFEPYYSMYNARYALYMNLIQPDSAAAQALIKSEKEKLRIDEMTTDALTSFDNNNSEAGKNYKFNRSSVGAHLGQQYRDGERSTEAFFQYDMAVDPSAPKNYLGVRYFGGDNGRTFDVYIDDVKFKSERVTNANGDSFYIQYDEIPASAMADIAAKDRYKRDQSGAYVLDEKGNKIPIITVRFQGNGTSYVGGVFGVYTTTTTTYATDADLNALTFDGGTLTRSWRTARTTTP